MKWTRENIPDQTGKVAIVTGGNTGLGFQICLELADKNAKIVMACRSIEKGKIAVQKIQATLNKPIDITVIPLDLINQESIRSFAEEFSNKYDRLNLLIHNAGLVNQRERQETDRGIEIHMATNHYGPFLLTGYLFSNLTNTSNSRVVTMSSGSYRFGNIDFDDINWRNRPFESGKAYGDSKLANLLFMRKLQEKFEEKELSTISLGAHPGLTATERQQTKGAGGWLSKFLAQPVAIGALPVLRAATDPVAKGNDYFGPRWMIKGYPKLEELKPSALDMDIADKLWILSQDVTGFSY